MGQFYYEPEWLDIVKEQESKLLFDHFDEDVALEIGLSIIELAVKKYRRVISTRIVMDSTIVFSYKMPGTFSENDWWMDRKLAFSRYTGVSSLRGYLEEQMGLRDHNWEKREGNLADCGGCLPVRMKDGGPVFAYILVSGMEHEEDHQLAVDAAAKYLKIEVPEIGRTE